MAIPTTAIMVLAAAKDRAVRQVQPEVVGDVAPGAAGKSTGWGVRERGKWEGSIWAGEIGQWKRH